MDNHNQPKSYEKQSASSSEGRRKKRPSLIPLRNSATRKNQISEDNYPNDHTNLPSQQAIEAYQSRQSGITAYWSNKNESQLNLQTSSDHRSIYSSPRTPRSSPKVFESDTPFVPFVHRSLTRTVWESEEIIPQEKEDLERKQSQTQFNNQKNVGEIEARVPISENQVIGKISQTSEDSLNSNLYTFQFTKSPPKQIEGSLNSSGENPEQYKGSPLKKQLQISIPVVTTIFASLANFVENQKQSLAMRATNQEYVSKAPIYYQQEIKNSAHKSGNYDNQVIYGQNSLQRFSFSYLTSISIRPAIHQEGNESLNQNKTRTKNQNLTIANPIFEHVKSSKRQSTQNQSSFTERFLCISKGYEQKIGIERETIVIAPAFPSVGISIQTEKEQNNANDFGVSKDDQLTTKQDLRDLPSSENSLNKQKAEKESIEDPDQKENLKDQQNGRIKQQIKVLKNFACQYDQNDVGIKPSIKRVSIADSKNNVIFDIDSNNSTITCDLDNKKRKSKKVQKKGAKSKSKDKIQQKKSQKEQPKPQPIPEKTRKSKRNLSKNETKQARV